MTLPTSTAGGKKTPATDASVHKAYADKHHRVSWSPWWYLLLESVWLFLRDLFARVLLPSPHRTAPKLYPLDPIILTSATDLAAMIRAGKVTSRKATEVYIERCKAINPFLNTVVADRFEEALKEADKADALIKQKSPLVDRMPFLGVPCTIKVCMQCTRVLKKKGKRRNRSHSKACPTRPGSHLVFRSMPLPRRTPSLSLACVPPACTSSVKKNNRLYVEQVCMTL